MFYIAQQQEQFLHEQVPLQQQHSSQDVSFFGFAFFFVVLDFAM
jgi:hypothetical protein